ncbi:hypothetical protein C8R46DRAFT_1237047 [Mycena filopes]|nr:hypothetical protein C8R46DRAFT_1237047 [Mycena filopes]
MSDSPVLPHKISNPWGITFIGSIISSVLYGITVIQAFIYYRTPGKDTLRTKLMVFVLLSLDTLHQVVTTWMTYHYVVSTFGDPAALNINHWTTSPQIFCNVLVGFMAQSFLVYRVWCVSGQNKILTVIGATLALAPLVDDQGTGVNLAAAILGTDDMLSRIIAMTIATGLLTSVAGLASLLSIAIAPQTLWVTAFNIQLSKLYVNTVLASLNARNAIRTVGHSTFLGSTGPTIPSQGNFALQSVAELPGPTQVHVNTDVDQHVDNEDSIRKYEGAPV